MFFLFLFVGGGALVQERNLDNLERLQTRFLCLFCSVFLNLSSYLMGSTPLAMFITFCKMTAPFSLMPLRGPTKKGRRGVSSSQLPEHTQIDTERDR